MDDKNYLWVRVKRSNVFHYSLGLRRVSGQNLYHTVCNRYVLADEVRNGIVPEANQCKQCVSLAHRMG